MGEANREKSPVDFFRAIARTGDVRAGVWNTDELAAGTPALQINSKAGVVQW